MLPIIAIFGRAGSGKSTLAKALKSALLSDGVQAIVSAFAQPVKQIAEEVFGAPPTVLYGESAARDGEFRIEFSPGRANHWACKLGLGEPGCTGMIKLRDSLGEKTTGRRLLQLIGTEYGRGINPDLWLDWQVTRAKGYVCEVGGAVIIEDGRFPNENWGIRAIGGTTVLCARPDVPASPADHESERWVSTAPSRAFDLLAVNSGSPDLLARRILDQQPCGLHLLSINGLAF